MEYLKTPSFMHVLFTNPLCMTGFKMTYNVPTLARNWLMALPRSPALWLPPMAPLTETMLMTVQFPLVIPLATGQVME